jgi:hypothetical protein
MEFSRKSITWSALPIYNGTVGAGTKGVQIGDNTLGAAAYNNIDIQTSGLTAGAINYVNSGGRNKIKVQAAQTTGTLYSGTVTFSDDVEIRVSDSSSVNSTFYKTNTFAKMRELERASVVALC